MTVLSSKKVAVINVEKGNSPLCATVETFALVTECKAKIFTYLKIRGQAVKIKNIEVKNDAISRIEAIKSLMDWDEEPKDGDIAYTLSKLPPVNGCAYYDSEIKTCRRSEVPREHGEWVDIENGIEYDWATCSICGGRTMMARRYYPFCPHCGADIRGQKE